MLTHTWKIAGRNWPMFGKGWRACECVSGTEAHHIGYSERFHTNLSDRIALTKSREWEFARCAGKSNCETIFVVSKVDVFWCWNRKWAQVCFFCSDGYRLVRSETSKSVSNESIGKLIARFRCYNFSRRTAILPEKCKNNQVDSRS